jgi:hypothetical protein
MMSELRTLALTLAAQANRLHEKAVIQVNLQNAYNSICDVLDYLNKELEQEANGELRDDWNNFRF